MNEARRTTSSSDEERSAITEHVLHGFAKPQNKAAVTLVFKVPTAKGPKNGYARNQWPLLRRYADDGNARIDNNLVERDIHLFTTGRKD